MESSDDEGRGVVAGPSEEDLQKMKMMREVQDRLRRKSRKRKGKVRFCGENGCGCEEEEVCDENLVCVVESEKNSKRMNLTFQVAAVSKPLLAVKRIVEK
eukprot:9835006-Karenia_brevis.AAC.1